MVTYLNLEVFPQCSLYKTQLEQLPHFVKRVFLFLTLKLSFVYFEGILQHL